MKAIHAIARGFSHWIDSVANTVANLLDRFAQPRTVRLVQNAGTEFAFQVDGNAGANSTPVRVRIDKDQLEQGLPADLAATISGNRVELVLQPDQFLFRPLELPGRAAEFLDGIVRAQIDRLTPWNASGAAFGWSKPVEFGPDRMVVTIAATALSFLKPYLEAIGKLGAHSVAVLTTPPQADAAVIPIKVWDQRARGVIDIGRIRKALTVTLAACAIAAGVTVTAAAIVDASLDYRKDELAAKLAKLRATAGGRDVSAVSTTAGQRALERRKFDSPSVVMALDALSDILPDHTYVTEMRIEANKLRLIGVTRDAPSLIELIERSGRFTRASFFAPTTRSSSDTSERFHIEAVIQPMSALRS